MKNILIIQPIDKSGIEILENHPDYNFEIIDGTDLEEIKKRLLNVTVYQLELLNYLPK